MTTAAVIAFYSRDENVCISYAGHPHALFKRKSKETWSLAGPEDTDRPALDQGPIPLPTSFD